MKIAIYSRKSKFTGKGESVENQISMCKQYAYSHFNNLTEDSFYIYEDEGFSGANVSRPQFQKFLKDSETEKFDVLIVYRLDRISRNVADFSNFFKQIESFGISFISIRENFDTSTPMGTAMIYISSVFAQLERDTIAERIKDNFYELAKYGRWLGGVAPYGYVSKKINYDKDNKSRQYYVLQACEHELSVVKIIFDKYLYFGSLSMTFKYMNENGFKTKRGKRFGYQSIRDILKNPVYCKADEDIYNYYKAKGCEIYTDKSSFDSSVGLSVYNRTKNDAKGYQVDNDISNYIIATGFHKGIIDGKDFIKVLEKFDLNKDKSFSKIRTSPSLLHTLTYCGNCGSKMIAKNGRVLTDGTQSFSYICKEKSITRSVNCNSSNINGYFLENLVIEKIQDVCLNVHSDLHKNISTLNFKNKEDIHLQTKKLNDYNTTLNTIEHKINNLVNVISSDAFDINTSSILSKKINDLSKERDEIKNLINLTKTNLNTLSNEVIDVDFIRNIFSQFNNFDSLEQQEKINLLRIILSRVTIYDTTIDIKLRFDVNDEIEKQASD